MYWCGQAFIRCVLVMEMVVCLSLCSVVSPPTLASDSYKIKLLNVSCNVAPSEEEVSQGLA